MYQQREPYARTAVLPAPALLGQVLGISASGFIITAIASNFSQGISPMAGLVAMLVGLGLLFAINGTRANAGLSLLLFYAFAACEGIGIAPTIAYYVASAGPTVVFDAALTTGLGMGILGAVAYLTGIDFRRFSGIAFSALIALVIVSLIVMFTHFVHPTLISWLTLAVFTLLVLIDFSRIRAGGDGLTPVQMAVAIYLDAINIFLALLRIFGARGRDD